MYMNQSIVLVGRVFTNGPGERDSNPSRVTPKTQKIVFDATFCYTAL